MIRPKNLEIGRWKKNERSKPRSCSKVTFNIIMAKYRDGKVSIRGHKNQTIRFPWIRPVLLRQEACPATNPGHRSDKIQYEHCSASYLSIRPPMPGSWGPPLMMYLPCPPWVGWYDPWTTSPMHFHPGWSRPVEGFGHGGYYTRDDHYGSVSHQQDNKASR
jgi:hypothetical protein